MSQRDRTPAIDHRLSKGRNPGRRLTKLYVIALGVIACLTISSQVLVQRELLKQESDAPVINIAGRQRMLSQRLTKVVLALHRVLTDTDVDDEAKEHGHRFDRDQAYTDELRQVIELWARSHDGLQRGNAEMGLPGSNSREVAALFQKIRTPLPGDAPRRSQRPHDHGGCQPRRGA